MKSSRKLALRREVLTQLDTADLNAVAGGAPPTWNCGLSDTCFSCLTYISCNPLDCVTRPIRSVPECILVEPDPTVPC